MHEGMFSNQPWADEQYLLGLIYQSPEEFQKILKQVSEKHFIYESSKIIWRMYLEIFGGGEYMKDATTEKRLLELSYQYIDSSEKPSVAETVGEILSCAGTLNPQFFIDRVLEKYMEREKRRINTQIATRAAAGNNFEDLTTELSQLEKETNDSGVVEKDELIDKMISHLEGDTQIKTISTGYRKLDDVLGGGFRAQNLFILAARPGIGKTALALNMLVNSVWKGFNPVFFSTEMSIDEIKNRMASIMSGVSATCIDMGSDAMSDKQLDEVMDSIRALSGVGGNPYFVSKSIKTSEIKSHLRRIKFQDGKVDLVFVDYMQRVLPEAKEQSREREVAQISSAMKDLAMEFDCPVIVICQPSRRMEDDSDATPKNSWLRDSGQIEQDADVIAWVCRNPGGGEPGVSKLTITKNRHGTLCDIPLFFESKNLRFLEK